MKYPRFLYHATKQENLEPILKEGLIAGKGNPLLSEVEFPDYLWFSSNLEHHNNWIGYLRHELVLLRVQTKLLELGSLRKSGFGILGKKVWWVYMKPIGPEKLIVLRR